MLGLEMLDVVIGMIFVFLTLSLVCSAVNEIIEAWLNKRSDYLEKGIKELLSDKDGNVTELVGKLYSHPLISGLFRGTYGKEKKGMMSLLPAWLTNFFDKGEERTLLPSYIPAQNFALALMDIMANPQNNSAGPPLTSPPVSSPNIITSPPSAPNSLDSLWSAVSSDPNNSTCQALRVLLEAAGNDPAEVKKNIENWFNGSMDRVSGWYKRRTQAITLILGIAIAITINADAVSISNSLSHDKALRDSLVVSAGEYAKADALNQAASKTKTPAAKDFKDACEKHNESSGLCRAECLDNINLSECKLDAEMGKIKSLGLPIGWDKNNPVLVPTDFGGWLLKLFGWLITGFAISLGAPFWFDLLNKFMVVRSTVKPREKSPEEGSKS